LAEIVLSVLVVFQLDAMFILLHLCWLLILLSKYHTSTT